MPTFAPGRLQRIRAVCAAEIQATVDKSQASATPPEPMWARVFPAPLLLATLLGTASTACTPTGTEPMEGAQSPIFYGTPAPDRRAVVTIEMINSPADTFLCTGVLIAPRLVLTAGHCLEGAQSARVGFGPDRATAEWFPATELISHPEYQPISGWHPFHNDGALLRILGQPGDVQPMPLLPSAQAVTQQDIGALSMDFVGFGITETGTSGTRLEITKTAAYLCEGPDECRWRYRLLHSAMVSPGAVCHLREQGGSCKGDSGGPALVSRNGVEYVAGLASFGDTECVAWGCHVLVETLRSFIEPYLQPCAGAGCSDAGVADAASSRPDATELDAGSLLDASVDASEDAGTDASVGQPDATPPADACTGCIPEVDAGSQRSDAGCQGQTCLDATTAADAVPSEAGVLLAEPDAGTVAAQDDGGCSTSRGGSPLGLPVVSLLAAWQFLRRRRR